jgi:hypothetical protein
MNSSQIKAVGIVKKNMGEIKNMSETKNMGSHEHNLLSSSSSMFLTISLLIPTNLTY